MLTIFGAVGSGSVPIEAALTLLGTPYEVTEAVTWESEGARSRVETVNPLRQSPGAGATIRRDRDRKCCDPDLSRRSLSGGKAGAGTRRTHARSSTLRWMIYVSAAMFVFAWIKDDPMCVAASKEDAPGVIDRVHDRIAYCWRKMDEQYRTRQIHP